MVVYFLHSAQVQMSYYCLQSFNNHRPAELDLQPACLPSLVALPATDVSHASSSLARLLPWLPCPTGKLRCRLQPTPLLPYHLQYGSLGYCYPRLPAKPAPAAPTQTEPPQPQQPATRDHAPATLPQLPTRLPSYSAAHAAATQPPPTPMLASDHPATYPKCAAQFGL